MHSNAAIIYTLGKHQLKLRQAYFNTAETRDCYSQNNFKSLLPSTSAFEDKLCQQLNVIQSFDKQCSCHLQRECVMTGHFLEALHTADSRWQKGWDESDWQSRKVAVI
jgi:hypothetical protein